jgi:heat shock protein HslJ
LIQIATDFEGEANQDVMTLDMQSWKWIKTIYNNDTAITPNKADAFILTFKENNSVSISTDCNSMHSTYKVADNQITFGPIISTKMFCPDSQEKEFSNMLSETQSFFFTSKGELIFELKFDSGSVVFR